MYFILLSLRKMTNHSAAVAKCNKGDKKPK